MVRFVMLINYTEIGLSQVQQTLQRAARLRADADRMGVAIEEIFWTVGAFDAVAILSGQDVESVVAFHTYAGWQGYVRSQLLQAFDEKQFALIMELMPKRHPLAEHDD